MLWTDKKTKVAHCLFDQQSDTFRQRIPIIGKMQKFELKSIERPALSQIYTDESRPSRFIVSSLLSLRSYYIELQRAGEYNQ